jgi:DNA-binding NtrC family response regulator
MLASDLPNGLRVLVAEDCFLIAEDIAEMLRAHGCRVLGPFARLRPAQPVVEAEPLDGALLDLWLADGFCFPLAEILDARLVPFVFLSGYGDAEILPAKFRSRPFIAKPFHESELLELVRREFACLPATRPGRSSPLRSADRAAVPVGLAQGGVQGGVQGGGR